MYDNTPPHNMHCNENFLSPLIQHNGFKLPPCSPMNMNIFNNKDQGLKQECIYIYIYIYIYVYMYIYPIALTEEEKVNYDLSPLRPSLLIKSESISPTPLSVGMGYLMNERRILQELGNGGNGQVFQGVTHMPQVANISHLPYIHNNIQNIQNKYIQQLPPIAHEVPNITPGPVPPKRDIKKTIKVCIQSKRKNTGNTVNNMSGGNNRFRDPENNMSGGNNKFRDPENNTPDNIIEYNQGDILKTPKLKKKSTYINRRLRENLNESILRVPKGMIISHPFKSLQHVPISLGGQYTLHGVPQQPPSPQHKVKKEEGNIKYTKERSIDNTERYRNTSNEEKKLESELNAKNFMRKYPLHFSCTTEEARMMNFTHGFQKLNFSSITSSTSRVSESMILQPTTTSTKTMESSEGNIQSNTLNLNECSVRLQTHTQLYEMNDNSHIINQGENDLQHTKDNIIIKQESDQSDEELVEKPIDEGDIFKIIKLPQKRRISSRISPISPISPIHSISPSPISPNNFQESIAEAIIQKKKEEEEYKNRKYICTYCEKRFKYGQALGGHMSRSHPGVSIKYKMKKDIRERRTLERERLSMCKAKYFKEKFGYDYESMKKTKKGRSLITQLISRTKLKTLKKYVTYDMAKQNIQVKQIKQEGNIN